MENRERELALRIGKQELIEQTVRDLGGHNLAITTTQIWEVMREKRPGTTFREVVQNCRYMADKNKTLKRWGKGFVLPSASINEPFPESVPKKSPTPPPPVEPTLSEAELAANPLVPQIKEVLTDAWLIPRQVHLELLRRFGDDVPIPPLRHLLRMMAKVHLITTDTEFQSVFRRNQT